MRQIGTCVSVDKDADSVLKLRLSFESKIDNKLVITPFPVKDDEPSPHAQTHIPAPSPAISSVQIHHHGSRPYKNSPTRRSSQFQLFKFFFPMKPPNLLLISNLFVSEINQKKRQSPDPTTEDESQAISYRIPRLSLHLTRDYTQWGVKDDEPSGLNRSSERSSTPELEGQQYIFPSGEDHFWTRCKIVGADRISNCCSWVKTPFQLLGRDLVTWYYGESWVAFDDGCPHHLAPQSERRIDEGENL
ncbi:hypothetical protein ACFXTO_033054 [Malus domestica]